MNWHNIGVHAAARPTFHEYVPATQPTLGLNRVSCSALAQCIRSVSCKVGVHEQHTLAYLYQHVALIQHFHCELWIDGFASDSKVYRYHYALHSQVCSHNG